MKRRLKKNGFMWEKIKFGGVIGIVFICVVALAVGLRQARQKNDVLKVPRIIHYCWFGENPEPASVRKALDSWRKFAPMFQIKRWDEKNCNVNANPYVWEAYSRKDWMSVANYCRLVALEKEGGLYLDTDNFMYAPVEPLLTEPLVLTRQNARSLSGSFIAAAPNHPLIQSLKQWYNSQSVYSPRTISSLITEQMSRMYPDWKAENIFQKSEGTFAVYPTNVLLIDFGGPENVIDHWYGRGRPFTDRSTYYYHYRNQFLAEEAYRIIDGEDGALVTRHLIFLPDNRFYVSGTKEMGSYTFYTDEILTLNWDIGAQAVYFCRGKTCENTKQKQLNTETAPERQFEPRSEYILAKGGKTFIGTTVYLRQNKWESWCLIVGNRLVRLFSYDWATVTKKTDDLIEVKWDKWGREVFKKQADGSYRQLM